MTRIRLRELKRDADRTLQKSGVVLAEAHQLIDQSKTAVATVEAKTLEVLTELLEHSRQTLQQAQALLQAIQNGVRFELVNVDQNNLVDFAMGRCDRLPLAIQASFEND